ncbi:MAG: 30S ribosomal protein S4 [Mycoplasma sp.]|nr:30S ribosomal protein S4 [Mycoplasma sp.]
MSRYTGPTFKKSRRYGFSILENGKEFAKGKKRTTPPGQHGNARQSKPSDYKLHLYEKQKVKFMYGLNERQFKLTFIKATKAKGIAGTNFLQRLESRLDNLVYRLGFANTRRQARQLVSHNHFLLNGKKANIASIIVKPGDVIKLKEKSQSFKIILENFENVTTAAWTTLDKKTFSGTYDRLPERNELSKDINDSFIVEQYNK